LHQNPPTSITAVSFIASFAFRLYLLLTAFSRINRWTSNSEEESIWYSSDLNTQQLTLQGKAHEFDNEARQWLSGLLSEAVRQSGFDAERRVARLSQKGGACAVFEEVSLIKDDYAKGVYLRELMKSQELDSASAEWVVTQAAREMKSDYEKRQVLSMVAEENLDDQKVLSELITATATIGSDYERGQTITAALKRGSLTTAQLKGMLQSVAGISSDSYQGRRAVCPLAAVRGAELRHTRIQFRENPVRVL
jgi:hypothetical protein